MTAAVESALPELNWLQKLGYSCRLIGLVMFFLAAPLVMLFIAILRLPLLNRLVIFRKKVLMLWQRSILTILGVRLIVRGAPSWNPTLTVSNHVSWLDAPLLGGLSPVRFIAKGDIASWPVISTLVKTVDTIFIYRGTNSTPKLITYLSEKCLPNSSVAVFPESTTTDGSKISYFFPRLFAAAQNANVAVQPVSIRYSKSVQGIDSGPFIDDMDFFKHLMGLLKYPPMYAEVCFLEPIPVAGKGRDELANASRTAIAEMLMLPVSVNQKHDTNFPKLIAELKRMFYPQRYRN